MAHAAPPESKINTELTQLARDRAARRVPGRGKTSPPARGSAGVSGDTRQSVRGPGRVVVEVECGITVYPPESEGEPWRAVFTEDGQRRYRQAASGEKLAAKLDKVKERLRAGAPDMVRPGADLIAYYLDPDRLPVGKRWSRRHADTQRRLCERFAGPVIAAITCQDITVSHMQKIVNAAPTAGEGERLYRCLSAIVTAGLKGGYLASPRLREVHWQAGDRPVPEPRVSTSGESGLWVDPAEIPAAADVAKLGQALAAGRHGDRDELMANTAAYSGLRQGELFALTTGQIDPDARVITVDRKLIEVAGQLYVEAPKCRKYRATIYPVRTPEGYPLAARLAARIEQVRAEQQAGTNPVGLIFPSPRGRRARTRTADLDQHHASRRRQCPVPTTCGHLPRTSGWTPAP
jgi:integrase